VDVDRAGIAVGAVAPDRAQQLLAVEQPAGIGHQRVKELELGERQPYLLAVHHHLALRAVERDRPDDQHLVAHRPGTGPPQHGANAAAQLRQPEWLGHVVVRARLEPEHRVGLGVERRQHDDRHHVAPAPQRPADLVPVGAGAEGYIEQDDVEVLGAGVVDRRASVRDGHHPVPLTRERAGEHFSQIGLVVDDENAERGISAASRRGERVGR